MSNEGRIIGRRTFLCWSPQGVPVPQVTSPFLRSSEAAILQPSDYRLALRRTLQGDREQLSVHDSAVVAAFDAATPGRLSVTYYSELQASDFLQRLHDWDNSCCWWNGKFGLQPPRLQMIIDCAYGTPRQEKESVSFHTDDPILGQQLQRLIACRVDSGRMPADLMARLVNRASTPQAYIRSTKTRSNNSDLWRQLVFVTCAVIQKYHSPRLKEDLCMEWKLDRKDRSFQFGRLLAVMERAEDDYYNMEMAEWSYNNGYWCKSSGSYHALIPAAAGEWGLPVSGCTTAEPQRITDALANGKLVVAIMSEGHFTSSGHFIVLRGVKDGKIMVADPASYTRSEQLWDLSIILNEASRRAGAGGPFWIIG